MHRHKHSTGNIIYREDTSAASKIQEMKNHFVLYCIKCPALHPAHLRMAVSVQEELTSGIFLRATAAAFTKKSLTEILYSPPDTSFIALRTLDRVEDTQTHGLTYIHLINCHLIHCFTNICGGRTHTVSHCTHTHRKCLIH